MANNVKVRIGPTSFLNLSEADAKEWRKNNTEYGADADAGVDLNEEQANQAASSEGKAQAAPAENKARTVAPAKKSDG